MTDPVAMAEEAARRLEGTCDNIANLGEEFEDLENDRTFCAKLDELVFCCEQCNWWFEQSEMAETKNNDWICNDCNSY